MFMCVKLQSSCNTAATASSPSGRCMQIRNRAATAATQLQQLQQRARPQLGVCKSGIQLQQLQHGCNSIRNLPYYQAEEHALTYAVVC